MSLAAASIGERAVAGQGPQSSSSRGKPPPKRQVVAKTDAVEQPEPR